MKPSAETIQTAGLTTQKSRSQIAIRIKAPFVLFRSGFFVVFPVCKTNAGTVTPKGSRTDFAKKILATQGCGRAVKFCLRPALNPRLGYENKCLLSSDSSRMQEWKQHEGRRHSCFALETSTPVRLFDPDDPGIS